MGWGAAGPMQAPLLPYLQRLLHRCDGVEGGDSLRAELCRVRADGVDEGGLCVVDLWGGRRTKVGLIAAQEGRGSRSPLPPPWARPHLLQEGGAGGCGRALRLRGPRHELGQACPGAPRVLAEAPQRAVWRVEREAHHAAGHAAPAAASAADELEDLAVGGAGRGRGRQLRRRQRRGGRRGGSEAPSHRCCLPCSPGGRRGRLLRQGAHGGPQRRRRQRQRGQQSQRESREQTQAEAQGTRAQARGRATAPAAG